MKKAAIFILAAVLMIVCLPVFAQQFPDVPADHWAYQAASELADSGIIQGYPDGTFGGKRALTRYEFAQALARAIPVIAEMAGGGPGAPGLKGEKGEKGEPGPAGPPGNAADIANLQRLVDEFREELAAQGVDIEALRRDLNALADRVGVLEKEVGRVTWTAEYNPIGIGEVQNSVATPFDRDSRLLGGGGPDDDNPLANASFFNDFDLSVRGRVSDAATVKAVINAGDYLNFALNPGPVRTDNLDEFQLWNVYLDTPIGLGPLGTAEFKGGRFPLQLTPLTLKFVDPDSYTYITKLDRGDYLLDGVAATLNFGKVALTALGAKSVDQISDLITPDLTIPGAILDAEVSQFGGARVVIGGAFDGNLGLTYLQTGLAPGSGRAEIFGADVDMVFGNLGLRAEFAQSEPNDTLDPTGVLDDDNTAWNANLVFPLGNLGLGVGYTQVEQDYFAPGYWYRYGRAVNLTNVKGPIANLTYALSSKISITADASFLEPDVDAVAINGRTGTSQSGASIVAPGVDNVTAWKAGIKYALTSSNSVDLGWEQVNWDPVVGADDEERYISIGLGHTFNSNSSLKLLYQIVEYDAGGVLPYAGTTADYRGGVAAAQFQLKY